MKITNKQSVEINKNAYGKNSFAEVKI